jgi:hypothetical protein
MTDRLHQRDRVRHRHEGAALHQAYLPRAVSRLARLSIQSSAGLPQCNSGSRYRRRGIQPNRGTSHDKQRHPAGWVIHPWGAIQI